MQYGVVGQVLKGFCRRRAVSYLGFRDPTRTLVKSKTFSKVVDQDTESRVGDGVSVCSLGLLGRFKGV